MTEPEYREAMRAVRRLAEILLQIPIEQCIDLLDETIKKTVTDLKTCVNGTDKEKESKLREELGLVQSTKSLLKFLHEAKQAQFRIRIANPDQVNMNNAIAAAAWASKLGV